MAQDKNYQSWYESYEGKKEGKFMHWYHSYQGKKVVNWVYSVGASVVIVGALFKILHWSGASTVLMVGMFTEAFLFLIGTLEAPHEEFHWANVFPELLEFGSPMERIERSKEQLSAGDTVARGGNNANNNNVAANAQPQQNVPVLDEKEMSALKNGINDLAKTAVQLSELGKVATATTQLADKMNEAGEAAGKFASSATTLSEKSNSLSEAYSTITNDMQGVVEGTKNYHRNVEDLGQKINSMNSIYEIQLNTLKSQNEQLQANTNQINAVAASMQKMSESAQEAMKNHAAFEEGAKKLASQVADLNKIYGNMLTALA